MVESVEGDYDGVHVVTKEDVGCLGGCDGHCCGSVGNWVALECHKTSMGYIFEFPCRPMCNGHLKIQTRGRSIIAIIHPIQRNSKGPRRNIGRRYHSDPIPRREDITVMRGSRASQRHHLIIVLGIDDVDGVARGDG